MIPEAIQAVIDRKGEAMKEQELGEFHWKDGWTFQRLNDGSVRIRKTIGEMTLDGVQQPIRAEAVIPATEWASIIHAVGHDQSAESFQTARAFHGER